MENYDEKMNYSFEPAPEEPSRPPLERPRRRSGTAGSTPDSRSRRCCGGGDRAQVSAALR